MRPQPNLCRKEIERIAREDQRKKDERSKARNELRSGTAAEQTAVVMAEMGYGEKRIAEHTGVSPIVTRRIVTGE